MKNPKKKNTRRATCGIRYSERWGGLVFTFCLLIGLQVWPAQARSAEKNTMATVICYLDNRGYNTVSILTGTGGLPGGFSVWGFTDFQSNQNSSDNRFDTSRYFMEYRLMLGLDQKWIGGIRGMDVQAEYSDATGEDNSLVRFGLSLKHALPFGWERKGWLRWRGFPVETDGSGGQVSLAWSLPLSKRLSINGFADWNLNRNGPNRWVVEPEVVWQLLDRFSAHVEFRYNGFEDADPQLDGRGIAAGFGLVF